MNADEKKILEYAITQYLDKGSYKTTMDELAKGLKISKKTIYKFFPSKVILLEKMLNYFQEKVKSEFDKSVAKLTPLKARIQATDNLIDQIVYKLYGLTDEEIKIIDEGVKGKGSNSDKNERK